ncbi:MAG: lysophospholipid acyltransferase family protein [Deltaproteobacteria bacterium]|nr:lysophospholipid acyltransferase family protein [Deltaproteobacteria bacterium]
MKALLNNLTLIIAPFVASIYIRFLAFTMKITYVNFEGYRKHIKENKQLILAFWHSRLMLMPYSYPGKGITVLVSQHRDGELVARAMNYFGIKAVRGSTTRGWFKGIKGLLMAVKNGRDIAITPDGPKGPRCVAQLGTIQIAAKTGLPIYPVAFNVSKKKLLPAGITS